MVADYLRIPMTEVYEMDLYDFLYIRREAFISRMSQTDEGTQYLNNAWRLEQTKPDREKLRKKIKGETPFEPQ